MRRRVLLGLLLVALSVGVLPSRVIAVGLCGVAYTFRTPIDSVTSDRLNSNFVQASTTNSTVQCVAGDSATLTQMNATVNPFPSGAASLATTLEGELQRIRFVLTRMHGATNWYTETQFSLGAGAGRLTIVSATSIQFCPFNGNMFRIPSTAKTYQIPSGCWTAANTSVYINGVASTILAPGNLAASTTYLVYLFDVAGTPTVDFNTGVSHCPDVLTGIEIRGTCAGPDTTRVLIGMVRTNASSQFEDDNALRGVLSFYNRRTIGLVNGFTAGRATSSTTYVELNTEIRGNFLTWADEAVTVLVTGSVSQNTNATLTGSAIGVDGTTAEDSEVIEYPTPVSTPFPVTLSLVKNGLAEGFHFATLLGAAASGSQGQWSGGTVGNLAGGAAGGRCSLTVGIRG